MATDPLRARALSVLRDGRCSVVRATDNEHHEPQRVMALVSSSRPGHGRYAVERFLDGHWECTCRKGLAHEMCAHVAAVQLVTVGVIRDLSGALSGDEIAALVQASA